jgi:hypothetical protein
MKIMQFDFPALVKKHAFLQLQYQIKKRWNLVRRTRLLYRIDFYDAQKS